ncbi:caspase family protein [Actinoalloteichus fjordicus]|uniref:Caspase domain-containing protein n=1 Tax=Actinoalloteichus fjordicus TaxID=1612552 RepID=A0AAC9LEX9_9PSEU|nr:caspase family protein [Actinoalloteichus fjordicus]APU16603.1 Caspase domain-containing protein [Actinoalloteichus fjordicus]
MGADRRYRALLIGNGDFPNDPHGLPALHGPAADVALLRRALVDGDGALFAREDVLVLPDRRVQRLRESLDGFFASAERDDVLLLYYSGHGRLDLDNRLHLCAKDTRTASLRATALRAEDVNEMISSSPARSTIVVLDCCHSGAFKGADVLRGMEPLAGPGGVGGSAGSGGWTSGAFRPGFAAWLGGLGGRAGGVGGRTSRSPRGADPRRPAWNPTGAADAEGSSSGRTPHRGRYVLASSRSTQLAQDTTEPGRASPFTAALVRGLTEVGPGEELTVPDLYRRVHRRVGAGSGPTPQLRFSGEGELVIARRPGPLASDAAQSPDGAGRGGAGPSAAHAASTPFAGTAAATDGEQDTEQWRCRRIRDSGIDCLLEVRRGLHRHVVEYRSVPKHRGQVFLDGRRIYQGSNLVDCEFILGRHGSRARLVVAETDIRLDVDGQEVYGLGRAAPGSPDHLEERAAAIRASLLGRFGGIVKEPEMRLRVTPRLRLSDVNAVRVRTSRSARAAEIAPIIAVITHRYAGDTTEHIWFTDRAMHVRGQNRTLVVPYPRLAEMTVSYGKARLTLGEDEVSFRGHESMRRIGEVIDTVRAAVVYQDTGLGDPPPLARHSGGDVLGGGTRQYGNSGPESPRDPQSWLLAMAIGLGVAQVFFASGSRDVELFHYGVGLVSVLAGLPWLIAAPLLARTRLFRSFGGNLTLTALSAVGYAAAFNWVPVLGNAWARSAGDEEIPLYGWLIRLGDSGIAIGGVDTGALGEWPRVWGTLLLAAVAFAVACTDLILLHRERRRAERER